MLQVQFQRTSYLEIYVDLEIQSVLLKQDSFLQLSLSILSQIPL